MTEPTPLARRAVLAAGLALALGALPASAADPRIAPEELVRRLADGSAPLMVDVRTPAEYAAGHVPGAINLPIQSLPSRLDELLAHRTEEIVVYCEAGPRARRAGSGLAQLGFDHLRLLDGHMRAWRRAGHPVERP